MNVEALKSRSGYLLGLVVAFLLGGLTAVYTRPATNTVELKEKTTHSEKQLQTIDNSKKVDIQELVNQLQTMIQKRNVSTSRTETRPDGTVIQENTVDLTETNSRIETQSHTLASVQESLKLINEKLTVDETVREKIVHAAQPTTRFGLLLGYNLAGLFGRHEEYNLIPVRGLVGQLQLEKRLTEPVWFIPAIWGVLWIQSTGLGGIGAKTEW